MHRLYDPECNEALDGKREGKETKWPEGGKRIDMAPRKTQHVLSMTSNGGSR